MITRRIILQSGFSLPATGVNLDGTATANLKYKKDDAFYMQPKADDEFIQTWRLTISHMNNGNSRI